MTLCKTLHIFSEQIVFLVGDFQVLYYWPGGLCEWVIEKLMASSSPTYYYFFFPFCTLYIQKNKKGEKNSK